MLHRYYHAVYFDVQKAQKLLELSFSVRNSHPKFFLDRDPSDKMSQLLLQVTYVGAGVIACEMLGPFSVVYQHEIRPTAKADTYMRHAIVEMRTCVVFRYSACVYGNRV